MDASDGEERYPHRERDAGWVAQARSGDPDAFGRLYDAWFDRCFDVARRIVRDDEVAAEVAQDGFLAAWRNIDNLADPGAFGGWILRICRNQAFNRREREQRTTAFDDAGMALVSAGAGRALGTGDTGPAGFGVEDRLGSFDDPARIAEDNEAAALLWGAVEALGERDAEVLHLQLRHGMSPAEVGDVLGMNRNAANQLVHRVRGRLDGAVRARVLWRDGAPACPELRASLASAGLDAFDADALKLIERHATSCTTCDERQRTRLAPSAMFAAIPLLAPIVFKQQAAAALAAAGVPMGGSAFAGSAGAAGGGTGGGGTGGDGTAGQTGQPPTNVEAAGSATPSPPTSGPALAAVDGPPPPGNAARAAGGSGRTPLWVALGAAAGVLLVIGVLLLLRDGTDAEVASGASSTTTTVTAGANGTATSNVPQSTTAGPGGPSPTTTAPDATTVPPTTRPTTSTTAPVGTTTTAPRTITIDVDVAPPTVTGGWDMANAPQLTWSVTGADGLAVRVHGPDGGQGDRTISTAPSSPKPHLICPVVPVPGHSGTACPELPGTYTYTVDVVEDGVVVATASVSLEVRPIVIR
ncbi:MAG: sigma-70 family RNA polymerase sigma factor [Acidimicrobiales bacterium]|nr:sigma-70 family RNA polymerase sigma factor [Acidimicrobiales bacterium]